MISEDAISEVPQRSVIKELDMSPTLDEKITAIKQMSSAKAPGEDGIPPEVCKYGGDELAAELTRLFKELWAEGEIKQDFKDALIINLYNTKGDRRLCDNHRGISLLTNAGKIFARVIVKRPTTRLKSTFKRANAVLDLV